MARGDSDGGDAQISAAVAATATGGVAAACTTCTLCLYLCASGMTYIAMAWLCVTFPSDLAASVFRNLENACGGVIAP